MEKTKKIFVNSMSDLFHEDPDTTFIAKCFDIMMQADWHIYQILTKRPHRMVAFSKLSSKYFGYTILTYLAGYSNDKILTMIQSAAKHID